MLRLFTGIELPGPIKTKLMALQQDLPHSRWQTPEQLHLTLNFIGPVDPIWLEKIRLALIGLPMPAFTLSLRGTGCFGKPGRKQALWAGVTPAAPLALLHSQINSRLAAAGVPSQFHASEPDDYRPHVTLSRLPKARAKRAAGSAAEDFIKRHAELQTRPFPVTQVSLFQSTLSESGSHYQIIDRFALLAAG